MSDRTVGSGDRNVSFGAPPPTSSQLPASRVGEGGGDDPSAKEAIARAPSRELPKDRGRSFLGQLAGIANRPTPLSPSRGKSMFGLNAIAAPPDSSTPPSSSLSPGTSLLSRMSFRSPASPRVSSSDPAGPEDDPARDGASPTLDGSATARRTARAAKDVALSAAHSTTAKITQIAEKQREKRKQVEVELVRKKELETKKQAEYQAMIGKYKLRSVSVSIAEEDAHERRSMVEAAATLNAAKTNLLLLPENGYVKIWELLIMSLVLWQAVYVPVLITFSPTISPSLWAFDKFGDIVFIMDFLLQFNVARYNNANQLQVTRWSVAIQYLRSGAVPGSWFIIDIFASFPYEWANQGMANSWSYNFYLSELKQQSVRKEAFSGVRIMKILRLPRLLRLLKIFRLLKAFKRFEKLQRFLKYSRYAHLFKLIIQITVMLLTCHYGACIWYQVGGPDGQWFTYECIEIAEHCYDVGKFATTEKQLECVTKCDFAQSTAFELGERFDKSYWTAYFAAVAMITAGENMSPITNLEKVIATLMSLTGSLLMAIVFGEVAVLISNFYARQSRYQAKMEYLFESMKRMGLPAEIEKRVYSYYDYIHDAHGTLNGKTTAFIPELSKKLAAEVLMYLRMDMIHQVPFFLNISPEVVQQLVLKLNLQVFLPKEYIVVRGEVGDEMYFIQDGDCEVTIPFKDLPQNKKEEVMKEQFSARLLAGAHQRKNSIMSAVQNINIPGRRISNSGAAALMGATVGPSTADHGRSSDERQHSSGHQPGDSSSSSSTSTAQPAAPAASAAQTFARRLSNTFSAASTPLPGADHHEQVRRSNSVSNPSKDAGTLAGGPSALNAAAATLQPTSTVALHSNAITTHSASGKDSQQASGQQHEEINSHRSASFVGFFKGAAHGDKTKQGPTPATGDMMADMDQEREHVLATLRKGSHFGEIALILLTKRTANVRAKGFCELCGLSREVYNKVVAVYIEDKKSMEDYIMNKYGKNENVTEAYANQKKDEGKEFKMGEVDNESSSSDSEDRGGGKKRLKDDAAGSAVLQKIKDQTAAMSEIMSSSVRGMDSKIEAMMSLQRQNAERMAKLDEVVERVKARNGGGGNSGNSALDSSVTPLPVRTNPSRPHMASRQKSFLQSDVIKEDVEGGSEDAGN